MARRPYLVPFLGLLWVALQLVFGVVLLFGGIIVAACWPLWVLWASAFGLRSAIQRASKGLAFLVALPIAWALTLGLSLAFWKFVFPGLSDGMGLVFVATLAIGHLVICTPWVVWDYARA